MAKTSTSTRSSPRDEATRKTRDAIPTRDEVNRKVICEHLPENDDFQTPHELIGLTLEARNKWGDLAWATETEILKRGYEYVTWDEIPESLKGIYFQGKKGQMDNLVQFGYELLTKCSIENHNKNQRRIKNNQRFDYQNANNQYLIENFEQDVPQGQSIPGAGPVVSSGDEFVITDN